MLKVFGGILISLIFLIGKADAQQSGANAKLEYFRQAKSFITEVYGLNLEIRKFILISEPKFGCKEGYLDLSFFGKSEISSIKEDISKPKIENWQQFLDFKGSCLGQDSLNRILKNNYPRLHNGWDYLNRYCGNAIASISSPIFLRNYEYCVFYSEYYCDFKCGGGEAVIYKKENGKWIKLKIICSWIA
ncbi:hypothetical protein [Pedobacter jeongneungensis]|uniref:hypothetical protein n=1 Tax=Pedobacter jeongneungensis TaxID=947309 RepID=UPI00046A52FB|nr:hypothetical protein [Pedobacter jeongneungensis]